MFFDNLVNCWIVVLSYCIYRLWYGRNGYLKGSWHTLNSKGPNRFETSCSILNRGKRYNFTWLPCAIESEESVLSLSGFHFYLLSTWKALSCLWYSLSQILCLVRHHKPLESLCLRTNLIETSLIQKFVGGTFQRFLKSTETSVRLLCFLWSLYQSTKTSIYLYEENNGMIKWFLYPCCWGTELFRSVVLKFACTWISLHNKKWPFFLF